MRTSEPASNCFGIFSLSIYLSLSFFTICMQCTEKRWKLFAVYGQPYRTLAALFPTASELTGNQRPPTTIYVNENLPVVAISALSQIYCHFIITALRRDCKNSSRTTSLSKLLDNPSMPIWTLISPVPCGCWSIAKSWPSTYQGRQHDVTYLLNELKQ